MENINKLDTKIDFINKSLSLSFKLGVALGGAVLLCYCWEIGYFPQDVSVGDGLLFILLAVAFGGFYISFVFCLTSLGLVLRPIWHGLQYFLLLLLRICKKATGKSIKYTPFTIEKVGPVYLIFAFIGLFFVLGFGRSNATSLATLVLCAGVGALLWSFYQQNSREIIQLENKEDITNGESTRLKILYDIQVASPALILLMPLLIGGISGKLLDGAMRLANIRTDAAVVHIKEPYTKYAEEHGLNGNKSNFGDDYAKFDNVSILFNGIGKNIVIEMKGSDRIFSMVIPSDDVHIIKNR